MTVSSRTPEGYPRRCPICGAQTNLQVSQATGDAPCPRCGHLLWASAVMFETFQRRFAESLGVAPEKITPGLSLANLGADSLDTVELVMELEEEFDITIPDEDAERIQTIADAIRYILERRRREEEEE